MVYRDLRHWLDIVEKHGQLKRLSGASIDLEMSSIAEIVCREGKEPKPVLLFDKIPGYPEGYRTVFGVAHSTWQIAMTLDLPEDQIDRTSLLRNWRHKVRGLRPLPSRSISTGPVMENSVTGDKIDVFQFPSPRFHELDGGRYIGTACAVVQREPDEGWVNAAIYRVMLVDKDRLTYHAIEGQHGSIIERKHAAHNTVMPIAVVIGGDPAFYWASGRAVPWGVSEFDYAGGIKGEPLDVIKGPYTGLPLPAMAEIVIEGECHPGETFAEGPFGEWHGYYANLGLQQVPEPVIRVKAIHYRNDPILTCGQMSAPVMDWSLASSITTSEGIWTTLEDLGIPGIRGVWCHEAGAGDLFVVISLQQMYTGHALQAGLVASQHRYGGAGKYVVLVDDDIDPSDLEQVIWAMSTRTSPDRTAVQLLEKCRGNSSDPSIPLSEKLKHKHPPKPLYTTKIIINACRPFEDKADWYPIAKVSPELRAKILAKWQPLLSDVL
ncbi:MAG: UbiD family decarboxylase [Chloroflexi bacterium]|nr:UbiD family decarboxylase [Chloroflexota bacterium]